MNAQDFCSPNASLGYFYGIELDSEQIVYCQTMVAIRNSLYPPLLHLTIFLALVIFITSISGGIKEHFKYFILNGVIFALLYGFYMDIYTLFFAQTFPFDFSLPINQIFYTYTYDLLLNSCFPIAFNRFFYLYYTDLYEKIVNIKFLILLIIIFDALTVCVDLWATFSNCVLIWIAYLTLWIISTIFCAILVSLKIRKQAKLLPNDLPVLNDVKRATIACLLQAFISLVNSLINGFNLCFAIYFSQDVNLYEIFIGSYIFFSTMQDVINVALIICDAMITLLVFKAYKKVIVKFFKSLIAKFIRKPETQTTTSTVIIIRQ